MGKKLQLRALESYTRDVGRILIRIDYDSMNVLGINSGDIVEISGVKKIAARVLPLYPADEGKGIVRMDGIMRENAGINIGNDVLLEKTTAVAGETITVSPLEKLPPVDVLYLVQALDGEPLIKDQKFYVPYFGGFIRFEVLDVVPKNNIVIITSKTKIIIQENENLSTKKDLKLNYFLENISTILDKETLGKISKDVDEAKIKTNTEYLTRRIFSILNNTLEANLETNIPEREDMLKQVWEEFEEFHVRCRKTFPNNDFIPTKLKSLDEIKGISGVIGIGQYIKSNVRNIADSIGVKHLELTSDKKITGNDIFIVHGHDESIKEKVARFIEKADLKAVILHEQPNGGKTIIEKFETYSSKIGFAIILLTPDDVCSSRDDKDKEIKTKRARQNVILELGFFVGAIGRDRTCVLYKKGVEIPSDYEGVVYIEMDNAESWKLALSREIKKVGLPIDMNKLFD